MDTFAKAAQLINDKRQSRHLTLGIYPEIYSRLLGAPRFLLDENAIHAAVELSLGRPKVLVEALAHLRVPYDAMWVEWPESGRAKLRATFPLIATPDYINPSRPLPERVGFLIETEPGGRKGQVTWAWNSGKIHNDTPETLFFSDVGLVSPYFDLDADIAQAESRIQGFLRANLWRLWDGHPVQQEALLRLWRTAEHLPTEWGARIIQQHCRSKEEITERLGLAFSDVYGEYIMVWSTLLLLTSSRKIVDYRPVDRSKLNKVRLKRREAPLLDHTEVVMHVGERQVGNRPRAPLGYTRKSPRVHMVSRYLARRGDKHWVVEPYWRGQGDIVERHVKVKGDG